MRKALWLLTFLLVSIPSPIEAQSCTRDDVAAAERLLALARTYEQETAWENASETYALAARSPCEAFAQQGRSGLQRVLPYQVNWLPQVESSLLNLGHSAVLRMAQIIIGILILTLLFYIGRFTIRHIDERRSWTVLPFIDLTGNGLGDSVTEGVINTLHEARFIHKQASMSLISYSETADLPSFSTLPQRESFFAALNSLDTLDISGMGLPLGSILGSVASWLDLGGFRLRGSMRKYGETVRLTVRLEEGRHGKCIKIWHEAGEISGDLGTSSLFHTMLEKLCYRILIDILPNGWETESAEALCAFTNGLKDFLRFNDSPLYKRKTPLLKRAYDSFDTARKHDPTYLLAQYYLALVEQQMGNYDRAIELLKGIKSVA